LYGSILKYVHFSLPFEHTTQWLSFAFQQLTGQANGLSSIYERIAYTIRELQDDKAALQNRIDELEQGDPSVEVRRLREENSTLRARLATAAKEKSEITWECDALLRKLNAIKLLLDGPAVRSFLYLHTLL
jgi:predicted  nucleic acid-binding Zn-ribbon protein